MSIRVSSISNTYGIQNYLRNTSAKTKALKPVTLLTKNAAIAISTSSLASSLTAADFLNKTKVSDATKLYTSGHWETHQPMDSSDYVYNVCAPDPPPPPIYGSGEPPSDDD